MIEQFIQQYGKRLYGLCRTLCANPFDADDLYQETWLKAVKNFEKYDHSKEFEPWLTRICVNTYRNDLRSKSRSPLLQFKRNEDKEALLQSIPSPEKTDYTQLYIAINNLPDKFRLTVILFYFCGMDTASTAAALRVPSGTVKSRLNKARRLLKEALDDETDLRF